MLSDETSDPGPSTRKATKTSNNGSGNEESDNEESDNGNSDPIDNPHVEASVESKSGEVGKEELNQAVADATQKADERSHAKVPTVSQEEFREPTQRKTFAQQLSQPIENSLQPIVHKAPELHAAEKKQEKNEAEAAVEQQMQELKAEKRKVEDELAAVKKEKDEEIAAKENEKNDAVAAVKKQMEELMAEKRKVEDERAAVKRKKANKPAIDSSVVRSSYMKSTPFLIVYESDASPVKSLE